MKTMSRILTVMSIFFIMLGIIYGILTRFQELVGAPAILLCGIMGFMISIYIDRHLKTIDQPLQDTPDAEIADENYEYGFYSPWSWWPILLAAGAGICFFGLAVGWWIIPFGAVVAFVGLIGLVYEYDRGDHAH